MNQDILRELILEQRQSFLAPNSETVSRQALKVINSWTDLPHAVVISGLRRSGKSTLLKQIAKHYYPKENYYTLSFEDERFLNFNVSHFNDLYKIFIELMGEQQVFFFDEIQVISQWERFVRRMYEQGHKFYLTGSNAALLSKEIGTKLTGRHQSLELYPFSFQEYLAFHQIPWAPKDFYVIRKRAKLYKLFQDFFKSGGMPEYLRFKKSELLKGIYDDILYRDIAIRHQLGDLNILRELSLYLLSHIGRRLSYNKLKQYFKLGSVNTIKKYIGFLEDCYLITVINRFSYSLKQQLIAPKKVYCIDNGLCQSVAFKFSGNEGWYLENLVAIELKRRGEEIFYYETRGGKEVDFLLRRGSKVTGLIQVTSSLSDPWVREREVKSLASAMEELEFRKGTILTNSDQEEIKIGKSKIVVIPVYQWLLSGPMTSR